MDINYIVHVHAQCMHKTYTVHVLSYENSMFNVNSSHQTKMQERFTFTEQNRDA